MITNKRIVLRLLFIVLVGMAGFWLGWNPPQIQAQGSYYNAADYQPHMQQLMEEQVRLDRERNQLLRDQNQILRDIARRIK